ncbi:winged helix-turn-helix domain-containing protein [Steroidobacter cummioxidans]|uniref:winged helix-turn-helix domain-containing protein n=1 Tax=Steroidobacter cummioxidans TaxID=1803913 RepID=UPI000E31A31F|nr:winged helix-turn-helix domain-containing protein [Steroidobacter cummioxidans]
MKYQIAEYTVDTARYRISSGDTVVPVEPKVFDLLVYLIRHRDRVLSREELFREVWDGREVSDATLSNHVKSARKILGDSGELQKTILTIRGRGYQFVAPVTVIPEGGVAVADAPPAPPPAADRVDAPVAPFWRSPLAMAGVVLLAALLGWGAFASWHPRSAPELPYVVVVPFDVSGDAPEAWQPFADQVTREVIRNLRKISGLRVVPPPSAFTFRDNKARDHIRRQLPEVQYVLDGVVSISSGNELRITVELEDLRKGLVVWDKDYESRTDDTNLFSMQSAIAGAVSDSLKVAVLAEEQRALDEFPTSNLQAYEAYVAGRYQLDRLSHDSLPRAIELFDQAIALDPKFFDAYIARSDAYRQLFAYFEPPINMLQKVVDSLAEAQQLRPDSAEAWSSLGLTYVMAWRWKDAWIALSKAKRRDPTLAQTEVGFALYYSGLGEAAKVKLALADANRLDPLNVEMADWGNWALFMVGESQAARQWVDKKMEQHPDVGPVFSGAGVGASIAGDYRRAVQLAERGAELDDSPVALIMLAQAYGYAGQKEKVLPLLEKAASAGTYVCPYESAAAYLSIGDQDRAMTLLDDAVAKRSNCLIFLRNDPRMKPIRQHPHYPVLLNRVGLDDVAVASYKR